MINCTYERKVNFMNKVFILLLLSLFVRSMQAMEGPEKKKNQLAQNAKDKTSQELESKAYLAYIVCKKCQRNNVFFYNSEKLIPSFNCKHYGCDEKINISEYVIYPLQ